MAQNYNNNNNLTSRSSSSSSLNDNMDQPRRPPLVEHLAPPVPENFENLLLNNFGEAAHALPSGSNNNHHHAGQENESIAANQQNPQRHYNNNNNSDNSRSHEPACWVFGYGSLIWNPGFTFNKCLTGYVRGYSRRFWQGNVAHRGTVEKPGRVATLVEDKEGITWGCAYRITGDTALEYLKNRECTLGGYATLETKFFPRVASIDTPFSGEAVVVLLYIATPDNRYWLGENSTEHIAKQIAECEGPRGHNAEYLLRLAEYMHNELPDVVDEHLFDLERIVLEHLRKRKIPLESVMGVTPERIRRDSHEDIRRQPSFEFSSRVPERKLRCLNI